MAFTIELVTGNVACNGWEDKGNRKSLVFPIVHN